MIAMNIMEKQEKTLRKAAPWLLGFTILILAVNQGGQWAGERLLTANLPETRTGSPNVILLVVDALRADHLSAYGYQRETSPFIDSIALTGTLFETAISPSSWTQPAHASLLTGRYVFEHQSELQPLGRQFTTIGEVMQSLGYRTGGFSANTIFFTRRQGFGKGFLHFEDNFYSVADAFLNSSLFGYLFDHSIFQTILEIDNPPTRRTAEQINRALLSWIDQDPQLPFFAFITYFDVHDPYLPPEPYRSRYSNTPEAGGLINHYQEINYPTLTPEQLQSEIDAYDGAIAYMDAQVEDLFNELEARDLLSNTLVIITSDHGESLGEHNLYQHGGSLYIQEIHVPLVLWGSGNVKTGLRIETPVSTTSLPSTILALIQCQETWFPSPSLTMLMNREVDPAGWPDPISEVHQFMGTAMENPTTHGAMKSVVDESMQYIIHEKFGEELYNWNEDRQEMNDLVPSTTDAAPLMAFRAYLEGMIGEFFTGTGAGP